MKGSRMRSASLAEPLSKTRFQTVIGLGQGCPLCSDISVSMIVSCLLPNPAAKYGHLP
jgi:hypothetical protein